MLLPLAVGNTADELADNGGRVTDAMPILPLAVGKSALEFAEIGGNKAEPPPVPALAVGATVLEFTTKGGIVREGLSAPLLAVPSTTLELPPRDGTVAEGCSALDLTPYPLLGINGGGGGSVEFTKGDELPVPTGAVARGMVITGESVREEDLSLPVRSPSEFVNSSSSVFVKLTLGMGVMLEGAAVKLAVGNRTPPLPVDKRILVAPTTKRFWGPEDTGTDSVRIMVTFKLSDGVKLGAVTTDKLEEGCTTPLPNAMEDRPVAPEVANTAFPPDTELFKVRLGTALTEAGSDTFVDGCGMDPVDAISGESVLSSVGVSSGKLKAPNEPPPSSSPSVPLELGVGTKAEAVSEIKSVDAEFVTLADAGDKKPDAPVESNTTVEPDTGKVAVPPIKDTLALEIGVWLTGAVPNELPVEFEVEVKPDAVDCVPTGATTAVELTAGLFATEVLLGEL